MKGLGVGEPVTVGKLQGLLREECNAHVTKRVIRKILKRLGYRWGKLEKASAGRKRPELREELHEYLVKYAKALEKQSTGEWVIVYMDESYIHQRHSKAYTWFHPEHEDKNKVFCGTGKGKRLIIVHAITKDGLLYVDGQERVLDDTWDLGDKETLSAEWVFPGKVKKDDYHKNMNGTNFMQWVKQRLIPTFRAKYTNGEKMILVLDNAPYHHSRGEDFVDPKKLTRLELFNELLILAGQQTMKLQRGGVEVEVDLKKLRHTKKGSSTKPIPLNPELRAELQSFLSNHPELQVGEMEKLFDSLGWELLWTPPYMPTLQPIELTWAAVKGRVASTFSVNRTVQQTREALYDAFYGDGRGYLGYQKEDCQKAISHAHKWCNKYIDKDEALSGSIFDLKILPMSSPSQVSPQSAASPAQPIVRAPAPAPQSALLPAASLPLNPLPPTSSSSSVRSSAMSEAYDSDSESEEDDVFDGDDVYFCGESLSDDEGDEDDYDESATERKLNFS